jgi:hypothetical protein
MKNKKFKKNFQSFTDPGHGWVKVPLKMLVDLSIVEKISNFSYQRGNYAYLEEDSDTGIFLKAYIKKYGIDPTIKNYHSNKSSRIRNYPNYNKIPF